MSRCCSCRRPTHGYCTLGTSVDAALAASYSARYVIAEINDRMPRTLGNTLVPLSRIQAFIHTSRPLWAHDSRPPSPEEEAIGANVASLVEDGATLQTGIGAIPTPLRRLSDKRDLGIHTEMFSDGVVDLAKTGAITNRLKHVHRGRIVTSFVNGSQRVYDFVNDNPFVEFHPCDRTNDTSIIRVNDKVTAINSHWRSICPARSSRLDRVPDLQRHRRADGLHPRRRVVGRRQADHRPALDGVPRHRQPNRAIAETRRWCVTTRGHVHWVVTEHGVVNLFGLSLRQRAEALIRIAHPDVRGDLRRAFAETRRITL